MEIGRLINFRNKRFYLDLILLTFIGYLLHWLGYFIYSYPKTPVFIKNSPESIVTVVFLVFLISTFFLIKLLWKRFSIRVLHLKNKVYKFKDQDWPDEWMFNGRPYSIGASELFVQSSRAGCLLRNHFWKDFRMTFEIEFFDNLDRKFGIVFRAEDLDNYFMLELSNKQNEIKPHVRYKGSWEIISSIKTESFKSTDYIGIVFEVKNSTAYLYVEKKLELTWVLPTHVDVMYKESGSDKPQKEDTDEKYVQEIPFRQKFGMIGFRAHPEQGVIIRGLTVEPL